MMNKSRGEYAYTMLDLDEVIKDDITPDMQAIEGMMRVMIF